MTEKIKGVHKVRVKAYQRNFHDEIVLVDENRRIFDPQRLNYAPKSACPAVGVSAAGDIREFVLPSDDEFWSSAEEYHQRAAIATAIENCGGKEELDRIFSRLEKKIRG